MTTNDHRIFLGSACNNACRFCNQGDKGPLQEDGDWLDEAVEQAVRGSAEGRITFCGGEATLQPDIVQRGAKLALAQGAKDIGVFTNGRMLAYGDLVRNLLNDGVTRFEISLHGPEPDVHDWLTQAPGSFRQTVSGIQKAKKEGAAVNVHMVLTRSNYRLASEMVRLSSRLKVQSLHLRMVQTEGWAVQPERLPNLVPKLSMVRPYIEQAVRLANRAELSIFLHGIPDCQANKVRFNLDRTQSLWYGLALESLENGEPAFGKSCDSCRVRGECVGVTSEYLAYYGDGELVALDDRADLGQVGRTTT
ncbi:MAG: hypothetical protein CMH54_06975 [Myxococcales bacterium]|nr:hypothetical protein [Myxococcales bacterium]|tara:strand:- start:62 stop:979 length:918 start_codon:yes stop_codon:yes gene_type:complete